MSLGGLVVGERRNRGVRVDGVDCSRTGSAREKQVAKGSARSCPRLFVVPQPSAAAVQWLRAQVEPLSALSAHIHDTVCSKTKQPYP